MEIETALTAIRAAARAVSADRRRYRSDRRAAARRDLTVSARGCGPDRPRREQPGRDRAASPGPQGIFAVGHAVADEGGEVDSSGALGRIRLCVEPSGGGSAPGLAGLEWPADDHRPTAAPIELTRRRPPWPHCSRRDGDRRRHTNDNGRQDDFRSRFRAGPKGLGGRHSRGRDQTAIGRSSCRLVARAAPWTPRHCELENQSSRISKSAPASRPANSRIFSRSSCSRRACQRPGSMHRSSSTIASSSPTVYGPSTG